MKKILLSLTAFLLVTASFANNILVSNSSLSNQNTTAHTEIINFDVAWENSWRTATNENNYDGAWIFVKFRKQGTLDWRHCSLNTGAFSAGVGGTIKIPTDGKGAFIYKTNVGIGPANYTGNQLTWNYGADGILDNETVEIRVFALEMVYITAGAYNLGSGGTEFNAFSDGASNSPFNVTGQTVITTGTTPGTLNYNGNGTGANIPATFPIGFDAFWIMKYETTQQQYADFLNHLDLARATVLNTASPTLTGNHPNFVPVAPERAVHQTGFRFTAALADWSGLRPYSDLEFEKACRGYNTPSLPNEYVWGSTSIYPLQSVTNAGLANETPATPTSPAANANISNAYGLISRAGIFARTTGATRENSGATYYGVMNMGDNVQETVVTAGTSQGRAVDASIHGDGYLANDGYSNIPAWQDYRAFGLKGSSYISAMTGARTSDRNLSLFFSSYPNDNNAIGIGSRLARTAP